MNDKCCNHNCNQGRDCPNRNKELTDEEIVDIGTEFLAPKDCDIYTFARAIEKRIKNGN